ncbi:MAG TPA: histidine kinase [Candidatus Margulisiibacteriota bacterium]|nr:histidine kinase [Candidatus Margulisiibacteriota bacterium]
MMLNGFPPLEKNIARCRLVLSVAAFVAVYVDPTEPLLSRWIPLQSGPFVIDPRLLAVLIAHFAFSLLVYIGFTGKPVWSPRAAARTVWIDVMFGAAMATLTEGVTSPAYPFFAFAVVTAGLRQGLRQAMLVTAASVGLYLAFLVLSARRGADVYIMRPVYLAITGYLVGYLGQQRDELQDELARLEQAEQRHRIARDLHDGFAQALAGINLRLEGCRRLLANQSAAETSAELAELQQSVQREYDSLRAYMRSLAGLEVAPESGNEAPPTRLVVNAHVSGSVELVDHVLQIAREGINNVRKHAHARTATIKIETEQSLVHIRIADDGVGFRDAAPPWSIASRVKEIGGRLQILGNQEGGACLSITLPQS